eukprot:scaffold8377_cov58-Phaeocystis_antarctica.AAC.7
MALDIHTHERAGTCIRRKRRLHQVRVAHHGVVEAVNGLATRLELADDGARELQGVLATERMMGSNRRLTGDGRVALGGSGESIRPQDRRDPRSNSDATHSNLAPHREPQRWTTKQRYITKME